PSRLPRKTLALVLMNHSAAHAMTATKPALGTNTKVVTQRTPRSMREATNQRFCCVARIDRLLNKERVSGGRRIDGAGLGRRNGVAAFRGDRVWGDDRVRESARRWGLQRDDISGG